MIGIAASLTLTIPTNADSTMANSLLDSTTNTVVGPVNTGITNVRFTNGRLRTDEPDGILNTIPKPLLQSRNGVNFYEYQLLLSGRGFFIFTNFEFGPEGPNNLDLNYLPVSVKYPVGNWNGRLLFYIHGAGGPVGESSWAPIVDVEHLIKDGWAVAIPKLNPSDNNQQNINASDGSYWAAYNNSSQRKRIVGSGFVFGFYLDASTTRNVVNVVKNLLKHDLGEKPVYTYWMGHSAAGLQGFALNHGANIIGIRTGGNYNIPYDATSGKVFDGFMAYAPNVLDTPAQLNPEPDHAVTAPWIFIGGQVDEPRLTTAGIVTAYKVDQTLQSLPATDPQQVYANLNNWFRIYSTKFANHQPWTRRFASVYNGGNWYYEIGAELGKELNRAGRGVRFNWVYSQIFEYADPAVIDLFTLTVGENGHKPRDDGFIYQRLLNLDNWVSNGVPAPVSNIGQDYLNFTDTSLHPSLPVYTEPSPPDFSLVDQDMIIETNEYPHVLSGLRKDAITRIKDLKAQGRFDFVPGYIEMPNTKVRVGLNLMFENEHRLVPFSEEQLREGYHFGNVDFDGYVSHGDYVQKYIKGVNELIEFGRYDLTTGNSLKDDAAHAPYPKPRGNPVEAPPAESINIETLLNEVISSP